MKNSSNIYVTAQEYEKMKKEIITKERNRIIRSIKRQKWQNVEDPTIAEDYPLENRDNECFDLCIKIVSDKK